MTEILSQDELDGLLLAISSGEVDTTDYTAAREQKKVKIYDFRRPDKFSKDHIRTLQMVHENFARLTTTMLSAQLRSVTGIHVASVDQLTFEEFIRSISNPTVLGIAGVSPLPGNIILEISPYISFTIIDRLAGSRNITALPGREHTDIELMLLEGILNGMISNLACAWANITPVTPELVNIETNPQFAQIVPPNDMILLVTLEAKIGAVEGMINICIPYITVESVLHKLPAQYMMNAGAGASGDELPVNVKDVVYRRHICYEGALVNMTPDEVRKLKPGMKIQARPGSAAKAFYEYAGNRKEADNG